MMMNMHLLHISVYTYGKLSRWISFALHTLHYNTGRIEVILLLMSDTSSHHIY